MPDLIVRPSGEKTYALQLRYHDCCGPTEYQTLKGGLTEEEAREIVNAGRPYWLFGDPWTKDSNNGFG